jgi:subfamily B ATP-binding cassette protein HlyB/CyaB
MEARTFDSGIFSLILVARFHGLATDPAAVAHSHAPDGGACSPDDLVRAAKALGLKAKTIETSWDRLGSTPLPAIASAIDGTFFVVGGVSQERALIHDPNKQRPRQLSRADFEKLWDRNLILVTRRALSAAGNGRFGFRWFVPAVLKHRNLFGEVLVASFFVQLFALITPLFFQVVIDKVLVHRALSTLEVLAVGLLVVSLFDILLNGLRTYVFAHTSNRVDVLLGARLFRHLLALPLAYFETRRVGDSVARVRELENIRNFLTGSSLTLVVDLFFTLVFFVVLYLYSPVLTAVVAGALPFYVVLSAVVTPVFRRRLEEKFSRGAENQAFLVESVTGIETLKSMAVEPQMQRRWEEQLAGYVSASFRAASLGNIASQAAGFINKVTVVLILWVGATLVISGELSVGQLVAFNMLAGRISAPILRLVQLWQDFQQAGISVRRLGDILDTTPEPGYQPGRTTLPALRGAVSFDRVTFRYASDRPEVLKDIRLNVKPGEVVGIVGRSGSGKSTLVKLIQRLYVPERGRVLVDGVDLALVDPGWLRRQIGVVLQENFLFNRSVRDNLALSSPGAPMERIVQAARIAGAHEFILEMPQGYDTLIGEHGSNLSGGQRQRIAIARALVSDPRILLFDEATSALDYESERAIQKNMRFICKGRTVFVIAHRLSAVRHCDRILVLDKGLLVEQGSHEELLERKGLYAGLFAYQAQGAGG